MTVTNFADVRRRKRLEREADEEAAFQEGMAGPLLGLDAEPDEAEPALDPEEPSLDPDPPVPTDPALAPEPTVPTEVQAIVPAVMQVLPRDFPLPTLIQFIPNEALRRAADQAAAYALTIPVSGVDGLQAADLACTALRTSLKAIDEHFSEPTEIANRLHKTLTGARADWLAGGTAALKTVGDRIWTEKRRLDAIAAEERRKAQEEADRQAREAAHQQAELAAKQQAPAAVVEELRKQAETITAPPVASVMPAPAMRGTTITTTWKARIAGTPACDEPNPAIEALSPGQKVEVLKLLKAILDGRAPLAAIEVNWPYLNKRAKADKSTLAIPGIAPFEEGSTRAKPTSRGR